MTHLPVARLPNLNHTRSRGGATRKFVAAPPRLDGAPQACFRRLREAFAPPRLFVRFARRPEERGEADYPTFAAGHAGLIVHEAIMESVTQKRWADVDWGAFAL